MPKKSELLGDKLRRESRQRREAALELSRKTKAQEWEVARKEAQARWNPTQLEKDIKKAAKAGRDELTLMNQAEFTKADLSYLSLITTWARENGMYVHQSEDYDHDWGRTAFASICWEYHAPRGSW